MAHNVTDRMAISTTLTGSLDTRTKLLWIATILFLAFSAGSLLGQVIVVIYVVTIVFIGLVSHKLRIGPFVIAIKALLPLITAITVLQGFLQPGSTQIIAFPLFTWQATLTVEGVAAGLYYSLRLFSISTAFLAFTMTTTPLEISIALHQIGVPYKFSMLIGMALKSFPDASQLVKDIENAQAARGFDVRSGNLLQRMMNFVPILVPLVIATMHRAVDMAIVLELKGFSRKGRVHFLDETPPRSVDRALWLGLPLIALALTLWVH